MIKGMIIIYFAQKNFKIAAQDYLAGCLPTQDYLAALGDPGKVGNTAQESGTF